MGRTSIATVLAAIFAVSAGPLAQRATSPPAFEAASVKRTHSTDLGGGVDFAGVRLQGQNVTLLQLIRVAYGRPGEWISESQIIGGPVWRNTDRFDIAATAGEGSTPGPSDQKLRMLQALLAERFRLAIHHETRDEQIYALTLARSDGRLGSNLHRSDVDCGPQLPCALRVGLGPVALLSAKGQTVAQLSNAFARLLDRVVIDRTGLTGTFDVNLRFNAETAPGLQIPGINTANPGSEVPSIFTAAQEQLGLKLESARGPVDVLVIDHVEQPTEN